jgi:hypothetical protein
MSTRFATVIAVAAAAATYFVTIDTADAQFRGGGGGGGGGRAFSGGGGGGGGGGGNAFRSSPAPRSFTGGGNSSRSVSNSGGGNLSFNSQPAQRFTPSNTVQRNIQLGNQGGNRPGNLRPGNTNTGGNLQAGNRPGGSGSPINNSQAGNRPGGTLPGNTNQAGNQGNPGNQAGNQGNRPGGSQPGNTNQAGNQGNPGNQAGNQGNRPGIPGLPGGGNQQAGNQGGNRPGQSGNSLAPNLRSGLGVGNNRPGNFVPQKFSVPATNLKLGRIAPPRNIVPRLALAAAPATFANNRWKPFLQRHWRSAFFWIAIPTIGYVTVPDWAYERFTTFVSSPEPDYDGAVKYLSQVAVQEEGPRVVRVAQAPAPSQIRHTVAIAPETTLDQRFAAFVNRQWSSEFVWISLPRIGNITCPVALYDQVQPMLTQNPPRFTEALALLEEAAANDTVVEEGALNDQTVESVQ